MNEHLLLLYLVALMLAMIVPGPDMMFVLASGMRGGPRVGLLATLGVATSEIVHVTAAYLCFLGLHALRAARHQPDELDVHTRVATISGRRAYGRGLLTNLLNPKMIAFSVAFLPQFVDHGLGHVWLQFVVLGAVFVVFEVLVDGTVGLFAGTIGRALVRRRRARQALDVCSGGIMIGLAGKLALDR